MLKIGFFYNQIQITTWYIGTVILIYSRSIKLSYQELFMRLNVFLLFEVRLLIWWCRTWWWHQTFDSPTHFRSNRKLSVFKLKKAKDELFSPISQYFLILTRISVKTGSYRWGRRSLTQTVWGLLLKKDLELYKQ